MRPLIKRTPEGRRYAVPSAPRRPAPLPEPQPPSTTPGGPEPQPPSTTPGGPEPTPPQRPAQPRRPRRKLTEDDVREIRAEYAAGNWSQKDLAFIYRVTPSTISAVVSYDTWRTTC
ncbi:hypothetical protein [Mycobacterium kiyosense]|uniref:Helix-turn-helix domain-containing protein n=1 Tax=Mycobacterium kiyosense TaxID=2871094 RepID=A0A9P3QDA9_9MYCO|nr:hypothetical protein [Mycobacterium kiyosense]GLB83500.1 hypothetical protein SRL2020028_27560 [Mycobacterium kiyosense]GLB99061.1 hypothetical protein SRL2020226_58370 [Mycobacterium kiyosense]GLD33650.1 hypothetical protein Mkiyose1413_55330 [Mycobacterium kiyosense]GLD37225.1 hypothetical protein Mkiyose1595_34450 [Mycobacterium kiyosense]